MEKQNGYMCMCICDQYGNIDHDLRQRVESLQDKGWHVISEHYGDRTNKYITLVHYGPYPGGEDESN